VAKTQTITDHKKEIINLIKSAAYTKDIAQVFNDFLEMAAIAISNTADFTHREARESRYMDLINSYDKKYQAHFPEMLAQLVLALDEKVQTTGPEDILGLIYHELELHNKYHGQFFTPQHISDMMALMACGDEKQTAITKQGYITVLEPCCGSGVMVTSFLKAMQKENLNYCTQVVVTAVDIDLKCAHMTFLQLALYGVPAVVIHGNSLTCEEFSRWYTPVYLWNGWIWREQCGITNKFCVEDEKIKCALEPGYYAMRQVEALIAESAPPPKIPEKPAQRTHTIEIKPVDFGEQMSLFGGEI
jgi:type I restriction-modification system DNA methylase subunit